MFEPPDEGSFTYDGLWMFAGARTELNKKIVTIVFFVVSKYIISVISL